MSEVSKRFELLIKSTFKRLVDEGYILPIKTEKGIQVGDVLIESNGALKNIYKSNTLIYKEISLNAVAIRVANELAKNKNSKLCDELYALDIKYSKYFLDSKFLIDNYHRSVKAKNHIRSEILWIKYIDAKEKALTLKDQAEELASFE